jgi:hypothetical protein
LALPESTPALAGAVEFSKRNGHLFAARVAPFVATWTLPALCVDADIGRQQGCGDGP